MMPGTASETRYEFVRSMLGRYQALALESLQKVLPDKEPRRHLYDLVPSYLLRSAKGFRPGLCIATCRAFGGSVADVLRSASVIELLHNAFLVHDDVEDESELRRGWPTLSAEHGVAIAVNVGDAMNVLSIKALAENREILGSRLAWLIFMEVEHMVREAVEGQAMEVGWIRDNACSLTEDDYLRMAMKKTSWYTCICPCRIGSIVATRGSIQPDRFNRFGCYLGAAFQIQDDLLNLTGDADLYGKEDGGDILEGKRTLILIHTMAHCDAKESRRLSRLFGRPRSGRRQLEVEWILGLMQKYGSIDHARTSSRQLAGAALREFYPAFAGTPDSEDKEFIESMILYMIERSK
jgi:geranylgeranyl diphosphate synthase, type II